MGKRNRRRLTRQIPGRIPSRISGQALVPFLLFWCLGSFALGQELARLPLTAFAAAAVQPLQSALHAQGALAHVSPATHAQQVATGLLGGKPTAPPVHKMSGKTAHAKTKQSSRGRWDMRHNLNGSAALRYETAAAAWASAYHGQVFVAVTFGASRRWGSQVSWTEQRVWMAPVGWNPRLAASGAPLWVGFGDSADAGTAAPCSPVTEDERW